MEEKILKQHSRVIPPATFHRNSQNDTIDTFFGSIGLQLEDADYSGFEGI